MSGSSGGIVNRTTAARYDWGAGCEGWRLVDGQDLSVIEERIPPGAGEVRHQHTRARQLFFVLSGELSIERGNDAFVLRPGDGLEVAPGVPHQVRNVAAVEARFLVVCAPTTRGDRTDLPQP